MIQGPRAYIPLLIPDGIYKDVTSRTDINNNLSQTLVLGAQSCSLKVKTHILSDILPCKLLLIQV